VKESPEEEEGENRLVLVNPALCKVRLQNSKMLDKTNHLSDIHCQIIPLLVRNQVGKEECSFLCILWFCCLPVSRLKYTCRGRSNRIQLVLLSRESHGNQRG
jgi:hypothetical protein